MRKCPQYLLQILPFAGIVVVTIEEAVFIQNLVDLSLDVMVEVEWVHPVQQFIVRAVLSREGQQQSIQAWSLTQFYSVDFSKSRINVKKSAFSTNAQPRFASVVVEGVLGPPCPARHT